MSILFTIFGNVPEIRRECSIKLDDNEFPRTNNLPSNSSEHVKQAKNSGHLFAEESVLPRFRLWIGIIASLCDTSVAGGCFSVICYVFIYHFPKLTLGCVCNSTAELEKKKNSGKQIYTNFRPIPCLNF